MASKLLLAGLAALLLALAPPARAEVLSSADLVAVARAVCSAAPGSEECRLAEQQLDRGVVAALYRIASGGKRDEVVALVRGFAGWSSPQVREACAVALGGLRPTAEDTAVLGRLLNDPVPAVRRAAWAALGASDDPVARRLADRAGWSDDDSYLPEPSPVALLGLTLALPDGLEPLRFGRDREEGILAFVTDRPPEEILDFFATASGRPVLRLDELAALIAKTWPGIDPNNPMQVAKFFQELQERIEDLPPEEQQQAMIEALQQFEEMQEGPGASMARWQDGSLWGSPRAVVLAESAGTGGPALLALAYRDVTLQRSGVALQWLPRQTMPGWGQEAAQLEQREKDQQQAADKPAMTFDQAEALLWDGVKDTTLPEELEAFLAVFPYGAHRREAEERLAALKAPPEPEKPAVEQPASGQPATGQPATEPPVAEVTEPTLFLVQPSYAAHQAILVRFAGLPANSGDWVSVSKAGSPDNSYETYAMTGGKAAGEATLAGQFAGDYEIRAYSEGTSRTIVARLPLTIGPAQPVVLTPSKTSYAPGEPIVIRFSGMPANNSDWIGVSPPEMADGGYIDWAYSSGKVEGEVKLSGEPAGRYEIRAYADSPKRTVLGRVTITVE